MNGWIFAIAILAVTLLTILMIRKIRYGSACCGEMTKAEKKVGVRDKNKKHYPFVYVAGIDGMICSNCARRVENALHMQDGILAKADLEKKQVKIYSKKPLTREGVLKYLQGTSYTLIDFYEEEKHEFK